MANMTLPGNPRYQPKMLEEHFGYDRLVRGVYEVELAGLDVLADIGLIAKDDYSQLTPEIRAKILEIPTTAVDHVERTITQHDVRAAVQVMQEALPASLRRWAHIPFTSYDPLDTGRSLQFSRAQKQSIAPALRKVAKQMAKLVNDHLDVIQIGRTHGQHALPITVGFWLATVLNRIIDNAQELDRRAGQLTGKISGAVGAYNAQAHLGISARCAQVSFERRVLEKLGLSPAPISTQILPPEPLAHYLFTVVLASAALAQLGRDCRHLMRTEIGEVAEGFAKGQVGSSTMAHKRNPINFENLEGMLKKNIGEFVKVLLALISEHQRDLTDSAVFRDFPIIVVNLANQLNTLLREGKDQRSFLARITIDREACDRNFRMQAHLVLGEPLYIALQMAGYEGDAHELVNHTLTPKAKASGRLLVEVLEDQTREDEQLAAAWSNVPVEVVHLLYHPEEYAGFAKEQARKIALWAEHMPGDQKPRR